ncbi:type II toxin-antitoxin system YafQ family toxin [Desulfolutivibrio sulfoxidireducens]|uniref:type II toxin-antitoxin system YafQ family toxin n=1 Tax=Desulfolutivibrio sulfoxidireducens TaxID=2773299 RepID=UPI00159E9F60
MGVGHVREINETASFKRDMKRMARSGRYAVNELLTVVHALAEDIPLEPKYRDHVLTGNWRDHRECHIRPDWLLVYRLEPSTLILVRTGSHSELFR